MIEEEVRRDTRAKEELIVLNDVLRLEVRRLREQLAAQADVVYSLENRKQQLILSMQERKQEISVHKDVLKAELKTLLEEKHSLTMDLRNRELTVEKLKSRFEASQSSKDDEGHGQSYYIIQAAQKREELRRRGDEYDAAIRKCEREIRALQTTLDHLNARNVAYRASFQKVDTSGDEGEVLRQLEERTRLAKEGLFRKKKELQRLVTDFEEDSRKLEQVRGHISKTSQQRGGFVAAKDQLEDELLTQEAQLDELLDKIKRASATHRQKASQLLGVNVSQLQPGSTTEEKLVRAEVLRDVVQNVLYTMGQLAGEFPEVVDDLSSRLKEAELRIPARPPNKVGVAVRSTASRGGVNGGNSVSSRPGTSGSDGGSIRSQKSMGNVSGINSVQMKEFVPEF